jgi:16S rRNA (guanine527-N7)-methyltransferase
MAGGIKMSGVKSSSLVRIEGPDDFIRAFDVSRETLSRLEIYAKLLRKWQRAVNLVAPSTMNDIWQRHFADSAQLVDIMNQNGDSPDNGDLWLDMGSGGGFPGLVLAIMLAECSAAQFLLVESNGRKCAFLSEVARTVGLGNVKVHGTRLEESGIEAASHVSARALASLPSLLKLARPLAKSTARLYCFKGKSAMDEIELAGGEWKFDHIAHPSRTARGSYLLEISDWSPKSGNGRG